MNKKFEVVSKNLKSDVLNSELISVKDLAAALGRSENSIRYHIRMGRITPTLKFGRCMSFDLQQVIKQLKRGVSN